MSATVLTIKDDANRKALGNCGYGHLAEATDRSMALTMLHDGPNSAQADCKLVGTNQENHKPYQSTELVRLNEHSTKASRSQTALQHRLQRSLSIVALLVVDDPTYLPIFQRLEHEITVLEQQTDTIARAREMAAQMAIV